MIKVHRIANGSLEAIPILAGDAWPPGVTWIDLADPTEAERSAVAEALGLDIPTRDDMLEIEPSSRLYRKSNAMFLTASLVTGAETDRPGLDPVSFILTAQSLVTVRHRDYTAFATFAARGQREWPMAGTAHGLLVGLLDAVIDRLADVLERVQHEADDVSQTIFGSARPRSSRDLERLLRRIGLSHNLTTRVRESLVSLARVLSFLGRPDALVDNDATRGLLASLAHDVEALNDHASYLGSNINFLLDSTLGTINIAQNAIIKVMSVAALVFLPPTLVAGIYGMNFRVMPELDWPWGYPVALGLMILSAILPYLYFKRRGWL